MILIPQNAAHWHAIVSHISPILFMVAAAIMVLATVWKDIRWQRVALGLIIVSVITTAVTFQMGEEAEHLMETDANEQYIHPHEELAETARYIVIPFGLLILTLWWFTRKHRLLPAWASWGAVVVSLGIVVLLTNVGAAGGKISHPEARPGWVTGGGQDHDDDDHESDDEDDTY